VLRKRSNLVAAGRVVRSGPTLAAAQAAPLGGYGGHGREEGYAQTGERARDLLFVAG
jgi:hypothetical protein